MDIQASILDCVLAEGASLNKISISANLNRKAAKGHLRRMVSDGLLQIVEPSNGYKVYSASEKGIRWLRHYKSLADEGGLNRRDKTKDGRDF